MTFARIPLATYRLQFNPAFRFQDAQALVAYLHRLGISDLYASPLMQARRGSRHGYDVTDPSSLNPELGSEANFDALSATLQQHQMGLLLDIVPNHMAASHENPWWLDVLENGPASIYASYFDIDWRPDPAFSTLQDKILLPVLGQPYAQVLEGKELELAFEKTGFVVRYYDERFPLKPKSYAALLGYGLAAWKGSPRRKRLPGRALAELERDFGALADSSVSPGEAKRRHRQKEAFKDRLRQLCLEHREVRRFVDSILRHVNRERTGARSSASLAHLLDQQNYRLAYWRTGQERINYRRFFDISELASLRTERPHVFAARHDLLFRLVRDGKVDGVRVDHVDGLYDPPGYLAQLRKALARQTDRRNGKALYVLVEKILGGNEELPTQWPVAGTTGYDTLNLINGLFVDTQGSPVLAHAYARFTGSHDSFGDQVYACKKRVMESLFPGEMRTLAGQLNRVAEADWQARDLSRQQLSRALHEVTACFPIYRTYTRSLGVAEQDRKAVLVAVAEAQRRNPTLNPVAFSFLRRVLLLEGLNAVPRREKVARLRFVMRWQQFTGPIMAKGYEDTALYIHNRLVSLNEVGGNPASPGVSVAEFHQRVMARQRQRPYAMTATATHDTKRGEDVRARINVLSELPDEWEKRLLRWRGWNQHWKRKVDGQAVPAANEEALLYQTLIGAWSLEQSTTAALRDRIQEYVVKAAREAKVHTSWREVNARYEEALRAFVTSTLRRSPRNRFLADFRRLQKTVAFYGAMNGLAQVLLKIGLPGVPDFYQGTELWDLRLVDPDNRRPVDFTRRKQLLEELNAKEEDGRLRLAQELLGKWEDGRIKLYVTARALGLRRAQRDLFLKGSYVPLETSGRGKEHVCAFARRRGREWALVAVPRLVARLVLPGVFPVGKKVWGSGVVTLPAGAPTRWLDLFTGQTLETTSAGGKKVLHLSRLFWNLPIALLTRAAEQPRRSK